MTKPALSIEEWRKVQEIAYEIAYTGLEGNWDNDDFELIRYNIIAKLNSIGFPLLAESERMGTIIRARYTLLMDIQETGHTTDDHYTRLEYLDKETLREIGLTKKAIKEHFDG